MIVPGNRLLFWTGCVVLPFATLGTMYDSYRSISIFSLVTLFFIVLLDVCLSLRRLEGISVELPDTLRMSHDREATVDVRIINEDEKRKRIRLGLGLPKEIVSHKADMAVLLPGGSPVSNVPWFCTPWKRGSHYLENCYLEGTSVLGFWTMRKTVKAQSEIRVYPNLLKERKDIAALFMNRGNYGIHSQRQVGQGRDFEKLRDYIRGDSCEHIHWKVTAKRRRPVTKIFQIERTQDIYVIIDSSRLSARRADTTPERKNNRYPDSILDRFITGTLAMGVATERQGDHFGIMSFSNKVDSFIRAKSGRSHFNNCRDILYKLEATTADPDFDELFSYICMNLRRRALLVFLTNLDDPVLSEHFIKNLKLVSRKHLVMINMLRPERTDSLFSKQPVSTIDDMYRHLGGHMLLHDLIELHKTVKRQGARFSLIENEKMCTQLVTQYVDLKKRQLL